MTQKPWEQYEIPDEMQTQRSYPTVQWINRGADVLPPQKKGGFFAAQKYGNEPLPGGVEASFHEDNGTFSLGFSAAILAIRWAWFSYDQTSGMSLRLPKYEEKARKRVQALLLIRNADGSIAGPVKFTATGLANKQIQLSYWALNTVACASKAQPWMFWLDFSAGDVTEVGIQNQKITPVEVSVLLPDDLSGAFIGSEAVEAAIEMVGDITKWRDAWRPGADIPAPTPSGDEIEAEVSDPPEIIAAKMTMVDTSKYEKMSIGDLFLRDAEYAQSLIEFIDGHRDQYAPAQVDAAVELLAYAAENTLPF